MEVAAGVAGISKEEEDQQKLGGATPASPGMCSLIVDEAKLRALREDKSHHSPNGDSFLNPWSEFEPRKLSHLLKFARGNGESFPEEELLRQTYPISDVNMESITAPSCDRLQATWIGHATLLIQLDGYNLLTDPVWAGMLSPPWLKMLGIPRFTPAPIAIEKIPPIDAVLLSHNHYDHCDSVSLRYLASRPSPPVFIIPLGLGDWMRANNGTEATVIELDWWEDYVLPLPFSVQAKEQKKEAASDEEEPSEKDVGQGLRTSQLRIIATPCQHWSNRGLLDKNKSLWCSFAILGEKHKIFFAGDTGYCPVFKEIGSLLGPFDLAAIPIGAYEPRETHKSVHINPADAVQVV